MMTSTVVAADALGTERFGLYVVSTDVSRSQTFYERILGKAPQISMPALVGFDVSGGLFAIVDRATYASQSTVGGNVAPYLRVADVEAAFAHVRSVAPESLRTKAVQKEGVFHFFRFADPDGNVVEVFAVVQPPAT